MPSDLCIGILTSGGDAQGMNAAVRAVCRMGHIIGAKVYAIKWGYQGLVDGGNNIFELEDFMVDGIINEGGTFIGSARSKDFMTEAGRKKATLHLVNNGINSLVVIGGDGSLSGADDFRKEWPGYVDSLINEGLLNEKARSYILKVVGMVGSIDNDFCGSDMTIGADSALHRITECVDSIRTTAKSHQRAFVLEVMGRNSGYLALISGIASGADFVFLPEWPAEDDWKDCLTRRLLWNKSQGKVYSIVLVAEGAVDRKGVAVTPEDVRKTITENVGLDTRVTILGHVQRGGTPSCFDRFMATRLGIEAVIALMKSTEETPSYVMCLEKAKIVTKPLVECVDKLRKIKVAYEEKRFQDVVELRGVAFQKNMNLFKMLRAIRQRNNLAPCASKVAVVNIGAPAPGMNAVVRAYVRKCLSGGLCVIGANHGIDGFLNEEIEELSWNTVEDWFYLPGSVLGTSRTLPTKNIELLAEKFAKLHIKGLLIVGGFEGMLALDEFRKNAETYPEFKIPMILIPTTMSNNVPETYQSIGCDTVLNMITGVCDSLTLSALSYKSRLFIVETMGQKCGFLSAISAVAGAAHTSYDFEQGFTVNDLVRDTERLKKKFENSKDKFGLVVVSDHCNLNMKSDFICSLYAEQLPDTRCSVVTLGHIQQGTSPSPFDRFIAAKCGAKAAEEIIKLQDTYDKNTHFLSLCLSSEGFQLVGVEKLMSMADLRNRKPVDYRAKNYKQIITMMSGGDFVYESEAFPGFTLSSN